MVRGARTNHSSDFRHGRSPARGPVYGVWQYHPIGLAKALTFVSAFYVVRGARTDHGSGFRQRRSPAEAPAGKRQYHPNGLTVSTDFYQCFLRGTGVRTDHGSDFRQRRSPARGPVYGVWQYHPNGLAKALIFISAFYVVRGCCTRTTVRTSAKGGVLPGAPFTGYGSTTPSDLQ